MTHLKGKNALVTGGSRGIGAGIARALAAAGANVALTFHTEDQKAKEVVKQIEADKGAAIALPLENGNRSSAEATIQAATDQYGSPDILVNNAGMAQEKSFMDLTDADWMSMLNCNLMGAVQLIQLCLPSMQAKKWGRIINIASIGGQWGGERQVHYAASKAALINLTMSMGRLYSRDGITCNAIAPGLVPTDMTSAELGDNASKAKLSSIPAGRLGRTEEIAQSCVFLASKDAGYICGQTLNVNGGMYFG
ncbi:3-oxoacyl-ACP reductase FabG [Kordiimonas lipolytica]|uniref:3-oxoacyl-ACP reductase FabG n=1 Tax=Kordiimonas lipolytica TaxID=1662421 RepID=A0ABV8UEJ4_9PROT|nr:3-oxoacyl-ACP reductase FabG [Kordiimonas lipolytica]